MLTNLPCLTGTVTDTSNSDAIEITVRGETYKITAQTAFVGAADEKLSRIALASPSAKSVNIWPEQDGTVKYASINLG